MSINYMQTSIKLKEKKNKGQSKMNTSFNAP